MWSSLKDRGDRLKALLLSLLFPSICPVCGNRSESIELSPFCVSCWKDIRKYSGPSCRVCAKPLISEYGQVCGDCISDPPSFSSVISYGIYSDSLATAINLMKFSGIKRLSRPLAGLLLELNIPDSDVIIPVPMTKRSLLKRGFNQSLLIAKEVSIKKGIPLDIDSLQKAKETLPQVGLGAEERVKNIKNAFSVKGDLRGKRVLLVDDVMTTGATLRECSKTLLKAGAFEVKGLVLARTSLL
ncbi:MAG: ComF family protein [Thermodesulfovibrionales bacterium]